MKNMCPNRGLEIVKRGSRVQLAAYIKRSWHNTARAADLGHLIQSYSMPNPIPLASTEEEERRTWVTQHHEVVRLAKDCFGDRFSNNEIFDRLKISRRTGYRALGNDERIGKAPGRKPKIADAIIREMIDYIENGGCNDVGNVWKHLAEKFAPDCNPKTVQDAVKKSGFKNYRSEFPCTRTRRICS